MIWGDSVVFSSDAVQMDVTLPDGSWRMAAIPKDGWTFADGELRLTRLLGSFLWLLLSFASFGTAFHASSLRRAQERSAESEERYRALVETAPMAVCVHRDGKVIFANSESHRMMGVPDRGALAGTDVLSLLQLSL